LFKCEYEKQRQKIIATEALRDVLWSFSSKNDYFRKDRLPLALKSCMNFLSPMFKHPDFFEENEWRLVSVYGNFTLPTLTRPKYKRLISYVNLPIGDSIKNIVIGPSRKQLLLEKCLHKLLEGKVLSSVAIKKSSTPYRNG
jgi:hypothetical protein